MDPGLSFIGALYAGGITGFTAMVTGLTTAIHERAHAYTIKIFLKENVEIQNFTYDRAKSIFLSRKTLVSKLFSLYNPRGTHLGGQVTWRKNSKLRFKRVPRTLIGIIVTISAPIIDSMIFNSMLYLGLKKINTARHKHYPKNMPDLHTGAFFLGCTTMPLISHISVIVPLKNTCRDDISSVSNMLSKVTRVPGRVWLSTLKAGFVSLPILAIAKAFQGGT